jgi:sugar O-acyltransferase (sialic acid O-acetyltransferase NeuD family)
MADAPRPLVILGAGRQGRNINDICLARGRPVRGFLDDTKPAQTMVNGVVVLGGFALAGAADLLASCEFIVGVGDNRARRRLCEDIRARGGVLATVIDPTCVISPFSEIGAGVYIAAFSRVLTGARVGDFALIEGTSHVGADSELGTGAFLGPGCKLTGGSRIGEDAMIGAGAAVLGRSVGAGAIVGANATVTRDIPPRVFAIGTPAKVVRALD